MKRVLVAISLAAATAWLLAVPSAAAQGRSQGHPGGASAAGSMGGGHTDNAAGGANASGPRAPAELLTQNKQLASKLSGLLPPGTDLPTAVSGFKNLGQFVAAVHVSKNLDIPFAQLKCTELATKAACTTTTGTKTVTMTVPSKSSSLGQAIHSLKPSLSATDSNTAAKQGRKQADSDIRATAS
jgi:hypothetical protein